MSAASPARRPDEGGGHRRAPGAEQRRAAGGEGGRGLLDVTAHGRAELHLGRERLVARGPSGRSTAASTRTASGASARVAVHEEVLLLDPERERWVAAEGVVHGAAREPLAGFGG